MKNCIICNLDINGWGRYRYCLVCGELIRTLASENNKRGREWLIEEAKRIIKHRKMIAKNTGGDIIGG